MKYLLLIHEPKMTSAPSADAQAEIMKKYGAYHQALIGAGALVGGERLQPAATKVTNHGGKRAVVDGPFAETKEVLGGFFLIEAKSREEALDWAAKCPGAEHGTMEVRPIWEMDEIRKQRA